MPQQPQTHPDPLPTGITQDKVRLIASILAGLVLVFTAVLLWLAVSSEPIPRGAIIGLAASAATLVLLATAHTWKVARTTEQLQKSAANNSEALNITLPQLRALWEKAPLGIILFEPNDPHVPVKMVDCNPMACEMHGYRREELIGQSVDFIKSQPWTEKNAGNWLQELRQRRHLEGQSQHKRKDGTVFPIEYFTSLLVIDGHELVLGMDLDATARVATMEDLKQERNYRHTLLDSIPDYIYFKDQASRFVMVSRSVVANAGMKDPSEIIGKTDFDFSSEMHARKTFEDERRIMETGQPLVDVMEMETLPNGKCTWALTTKTPFRNERGEIIGTCGITKNITPIKEAEEETKRARKIAEDADRAKSEFLAVMSHEIRTPMNGVLGFTNLLLDTALGTEQRDWLLTIRSSGESLLTLINDILDFSKIEAGRMEFDLHPVSLRRCVEEVLDLLGSRANQKKIELLHWIDTDVPEWVMSDSTRLRQILVNLVGNAIKFTTKGEVEVRISCAQIAPDQAPLLSIVVRDTGEGIPPDRVNRLFRPFSQVDSSTTRRFGGTGLGLAISRSLAHLLGGNIELASSSPQGSSFCFTVQPAITTPPADQTAGMPILHPAVALEGRRAMIVDDNECNRRILTCQLKRWGIVCESFEEPIKAIEYISEHGEFDLAILDMMMPAMHGVELASLLHQVPGRNTLPLILLSSVSREELRVFNPMEHFSVVLTKPVRQSALLEALNKTLADTRHAETVKPPAPVAPTTVAMKFDPAMGKQHPLRIIVAEDNLVNQKLIAGLLRRLGYQPQLVGHGLSCIEALRRDIYDLILMDCQMPEMDGYEATIRIRKGEAGEHNRSITIIALTAAAMVGDREKCLNAGMNDYLTKPLQAPDLIRLILASPAVSK